MSIWDLERSKELRKEGERLGRMGMSARAQVLLDEYVSAHQEHYPKAIIELVGRFHALYVATKANGYWREKANIGYELEYYDIRAFEIPEKFMGGEEEGPNV